MTQVELPQLSLQRYVDLVRRRRWQLVPISLLGLVVGAVVAFLIPKYYVAEASVEHQEVAGEMERGENPFKRIVDSSQETIRLAAGKAMEALKWPEAAIGDPSRRTLEEAKVRSRLVVIDSNAGDKTRTYAHIRILYKDTDAQRSADFANALVDTWIQGRVQKLRSSHQEQATRANADFAEWDRTYERYLQEKQDLEVRFRIRPDFDPRLQQEEMRRRQDTQRMLREQLRDRETKVAMHKADAERTRTELAATAERVAPSQRELLEAARTRPELAPLLLQLQLSVAGLEAWKPGTRERTKQEREIARMRDTIFASMALDLDADGKIANPAHAALVKKLADAVAAGEQLVGEIERLQRDIAADTQEIEQLAEGYRLIESKRKDLDTAAQKRADAAARQQKQGQYLAALEQALPVQPLQRASPPPHPTDPNILVVALIGAVLGLGAAIGLILLLDLLQGTFKTAEDVERALGVQVLGAMSHMETDAERTFAVRSRRRAGVTAFLFMGLVVAVVVVYYRAPTRLPGIVRDLLALVLGV